MKPFAIIAAGILFAIGLGETVAPHTANAANFRAEQYLIVMHAPGQTDAQLQDQLNNLAADGWVLRCSLSNGVIMAR